MKVFLNSFLLLTWLAGSVGMGIPATQAEDSAAAASPKNIKALMITGGCCHDYERQKLILTQGISARAPVEWTIVHQGGSTTDTKIPVYEDENWAEGFDIIVHNECFAGVRDKEWVDRILKPHREGIPAILIHCSMHCYRTGDDRWFEFCGLQSPGHGPQFAYLVENLEPEHPIMKEFGESWMTPKGELYHSVRLFDTATPLAHAKRQSDNQPQVCIWTNQYHKARVFATTIGHHNETMAEPAYLDMLTRGLLWAVNRDPAEVQKTADETDLEILKLVNIPVGEQKKETLDVACCGAGNLAFGRKTTASSEESGKKNFSQNAVDGNLKTRWCANSSKPGEWWQVDLEQPEEVQSVRIHWEGGAAYRYKVEASADGEKWTTIVDQSENKTAGKIRGHQVNSPNTRYLRVTFLGANTGNWGSFWEFEAYSGDLPELPEEVRTGATPITISDVQAPPEFEVRLFGTPPKVNYPVCLACSPEGDVFVGVDEMGSLGKEAGRGKILRCRDTNGDGKADQIQEFAQVDHPRGLIYDQGKLWVLNTPRLTLFHDDDGDGVADREEVLIEGISTDQVGKRGADHTTNGIRLGIDGWIYIAIGDYGVLEAKGTDGRVLNRRGGGVIRVRPDGTDMEFYAWGLRNILDVCIDPTLNMFTRDNTNDGGGWDVRLSQIFQGAEYGYPSWYVNFSQEIMPPLADYGGGSGCGGMFLTDRRWPAPFANTLYTCDWGRSEVYRHPLQPNGPTFQAEQEVFLKIPRPTDIDVDGRGLMYVSSWKNGKFNYDGPNVGFVAQIRPKDFLPKPVPDFDTLSGTELLQGLNSPSAVRQLAASRTLLRRLTQEEQRPALVEGLNQLAGDESAELSARVAALFTLKQGLGAESHPGILKLVASETMREYALRALTDRKGELQEVPSEPFLTALNDANPRVQAQALISLARLERPETASAILPLTIRQDEAPQLDKGFHKRPDAGRVLPHLAVRALVALQADQVCLEALHSSFRAGALWALKYQHQESVVQALLKEAQTAQEVGQQQEILALLIRLAHREGDYKEGWWGTRPDHSGPYYDRAEWEQTPQITEFLRQRYTQGTEQQRTFLRQQLVLHHLNVPGLPRWNAENLQALENSQPIVIPPVDPNNQQQIANRNAAEVIAEVLKSAGQGNIERGQQLFTSQSCQACHTVAEGQTPKGPHLVDIGKRYSRAELIESILKPSAKIAQGFDTQIFVMADGKQHVGFVTSESAETITIRKNDGLAVELIQEEIEIRQKQEQSMMPQGLIQNLTAEQFGDLLDYLASIRSDKGK